MSGAEISTLLTLTSTYAIFADKLSSFLKKRKKRSDLSNEELELIAELADRVKKVAPSENMKNMNSAQIALTSREISEISKKSADVIAPLRSDPSLSDTSQSDLEALLEEPIEIQQKALDLSNAA